MRKPAAVEALDRHVLMSRIKDEHRRRNFAMESRKRQDLALGAYLRIQLGYRTPPTKSEAAGITKEQIAAIEKANKSAKEAATVIMEEAERISKLPKVEHATAVAESKVKHFAEFGAEAVASYVGRQPLANTEELAKKKLGKLAMSLEVWDGFAASVCGFGEVSLGQIIAEAGDLSRYANPGKLWRRMGLAPHPGNDGLDHLPSTLKRRGELKDGGTVAIVKYSPARRSKMYMIAKSLLKHQSEYRDLYLARKAYEHSKAEERGLIPATESKDTVEGWAENGLPPLTLVKKLDPDIHASAGHMDAKARVYVEKRLLKNLWRAWRRLDGLSYEEPIEYQNAA